ncbi:MAG TPA: aminomethyl-transferring glycine dehydrogenase subunit GcvPA [Chloroflexota bacterium]|nr:aminomethyl-transferring glycine dehydrogenase subunit GcvPA [Chloroflexota bacterium]
MPYLPHTEADRAAMLAAIGARSMEDLLSPIPASLRCGPLDLPAAASEPELLRELNVLAHRNTLEAGSRAFLGGGAYQHHIPAAVSALAARGEFVTAYTPYQPEVSQGTLQVIYEWQSMICDLTGLDVSNASLYDAATGCAEAAMMAVNATGRTAITVAGTINPQYLAVLRTYCWSQGLSLRVAAVSEGRTAPADLEALVDNECAAVIAQSPNYLGLIEDQAALAELAHAAGAFSITCADPLSLALLATPGESGADIAVGDAQPFGIALQYGGPYAGYIAARESLLRRMPGRIVGAGVDSKGRRAYVMTLRGREQDIRREKATSNICSNHALCATIATIYLSYMGREGLRQLANLCVQKAHYAAERIAALPGYVLANPGPFFHEFAVRTPRPGAPIRDALLDRGILAGIPLDGEMGINQGLLICVTEVNAREDIDALIEGLAEVAA